MMDSIFRQYDIRGKIGSEWLVEETYDLACAIARYLIDNGKNIKKVVVGADGRTHSPAIKEEICRALQDSGLDVIYLGTCPTPAMYFALHNLPVDAGLMITASHNGKEYNGIKICLGTDSVWGEQIQEIKKLLQKKSFFKAPKTGSYAVHNIIEDYINWFMQNFSHLVGMQMSAIVDCGNGAAGTVWPLLIEKMQWPNVQLLFEEVDGTYPNHEADPTVEKNMLSVKQILATGAYDVGLGLDGDCDRMAPMTKEGQLVAGDKLLALFADQIRKEHPKMAVVFDIKCSSGLQQLLDAWHLKPCVSPSGHSIIKNAIKQHNALLAGELSCHFFFKDRYFGYDDGNYAAFRLFELLMRTGKSLEELLQVFPKKYATPEIRVECMPQVMPALLHHVKSYFTVRNNAQIMTIDGVRVNMDHGWGLIRSSNTQPVICLRFEADSPEGLMRLKDDFVQALSPYFDEKFLHKEINQ